MPRPSPSGQLIPRTQHRAPPEPPRPELAEQFATACGLQGRWRLVVRNEATGATEKFDIDEPFVLVGRSSSCQVRLNHPDVGYRHAYLQVIGGRVCCYDLDSEYGIRWGTVLRKEGLVSAKDVLNIGPFSLRLSQAAAFGLSLSAAESESKLANPPLDRAALRFMNAFGRSSHSPLRPVREHITLLGRSGRCHVKLSDTSVSQVHCSVVHVEGTYWVVDLLGRDGTKVNGRTIRCTPFEDGDELMLGRFKMQFCEAVGDEDSVLAHTNVLNTTAGAQRRPVPDDVHDDCDVIPVTTPKPPAATHNQATFHAPVVGPVHGISEGVLLAMMGQFAQMQQQLLVHSHQQMTMLAQLFGNLNQGQQATIMEQLHSIHEITSELNRLRTNPSAWSGMAAAQPASAPAPVLPVIVPPVADIAASAAPPMAAPPMAPVPPVSEATVCEQEQLAQPESTAVPYDAERELEPLFDAADASDAGPLHEPAAAADPSLRDNVADHQWVTQRINDLERERNGRWKRLLQLIGGGGDLN